MKKKTVRIIAGAIVLLAVFSLLLLNQPDDTCSDDVRGYERDFSSTISALRATFNSIEASMHGQDHLKVPQLAGLNALTLTALRGIDTQCKLLRQCVRFVYFNPPSEACPTEYTDYRETRNSALALLKEIQGIQPAVRSAAQEAEQLHGARQDVESLENTSGSTGGRLAILKARVGQLEGNLSQALAGISDQIDGVISTRTKRTDQ